MWSRALGDTLDVLLNSFSQCGSSTLMFSLSLVAFFPLGNVSAMVVGR